jgi:hypothetical protein
MRLFSSLRPTYLLVISLVVARDLPTCIAEPAAVGSHSCDVIWKTPSTGANGSMPLGNGEVGLNLWVEEGGDLLFYVARTDAWSECSQLLKLGRVRLGLEPNPFAAGKPFCQTLKLRSGCVEINAGGVTLRIFVDTAQPVVYVTCSSDQPLRARASVEVWRSQRRDLKAEEKNFPMHNAGSWTMRGAEFGPPDVEAWESADIVDATQTNSLAWYHKNAYSVVHLSLELQGLRDAVETLSDPLEHRTSGGCLSGAGFVKDGDRALRSATEVKEFELRLVAHVAQNQDAAAWREGAAAILAQAPPVDTAAGRTADWWQRFWDRSWVEVDAGANSEQINQGYALQRWINACGGRGNYPIKFNGSIFTVDPKYTGKPDISSPDWRDWGDCYWWQNTRLPYQPMPACGDFDLMQPLFRFYREAAPLCKARSKIYHHVDGLYFPETMTIFGTYGNGDYGWDRRYLKPSDVMAPAWQYAWQQGLELVGLMLDYYDYTGDDELLSRELVPMARDVIAYFSARFPRDQHEKIVLSPTQVLETYRPQDILDQQGKPIGRNEVVNDTPTVAGLHSVVARLLALPPSKLPPAERNTWVQMSRILPPLPIATESGKSYIRPAEQYPKNAWNIENGELYAVSPFRLFRVGQKDLETGTNTYARRLFLDVGGWTYDGQCAALLGMTAEAQRQLLAKCANKNPNHRFPAMWGPNYDWLPDQTLGGNLMLTLQYMILQADRDKIYLLPAWPKDWNVRFKLCAPKRTVIEGVFAAGKFESLSVSPPERRADLVFANGAP